MARIRALKPEFWDSPSTAQASLAARLLFLAMWNWADDSGRGTAGLKELEAFAFPNDDVREFHRHKDGNSGEVPATTPELYRSFAELCGDVSEAYGVMFYKVKNRPYYVIPSFRSHQAKDFRPASKYPLETEGEFFDVTSGNAILSRVPDAAISTSPGASAHEAGNSAPMAGKKNTVIGEQGNRVIGEQGTRVTEEKDLLTGSADEPLIEAEILEDPKSQNRFEEFWTAYPRKVGKQKAIAKYKAALNRATPEEIIDGAHRLSNDPNLPEQQFIPHATTWLERNGWEDEPLPVRFRTKSEERIEVGREIAARAMNRPKMINPFES